MNLLLRGMVTKLAADEDEVFRSGGRVLFRSVVTVELVNGGGELTYVVPAGREPQLGAEVTIEVRS